MIPGLEMYMIKCKHCGFEEMKPRMNNSAFRFRRLKFGMEKNCKCPKCAEKAKEIYMGPAH